MTTMSTGLPWLTILGLIPLVGALLVAFLPGSAETAKRMALGFSLVTLVVGIIAATQFDRGSSDQFQLVEQHAWIPQFGVSYALGVDGIALVLILMALVLTPICLLAAWRDVPEESEPRGGQRVKTYFALLLVLETFMVGVFAATDVFLFYVFFEAMLIPVYFLIGRFGGARRQYAAMKFLLFSLAGGLVMLVAVIALYLQGPGGTDGFLIERLTGLTIDPTTERLLFVGFFLAFAVKAPMVPFHTWLPDAATESTPATATLLVGVLDKVGTFGMIRFCLQLFPDASQWATPVVVALAVISVIYGALLAIGQTDMMRLISYTSVSHFGFIVLGIFAFTSVGQAGSDALHGQPRLLDGGAVPLRGDARASTPHQQQAHRRLRRVAARHPGPRGDLPRGRSVSPRAAGSVELRVRVPRARRVVLDATGRHRHRDRGHHPRGALHPADVQADHDRAQARGAGGRGRHGR